MSRSRAALPVLALTLTAAAGGPIARTVEIAPAEQPTSLTQAPGDPSRLFFTERAGRIRIILDGVLRKQPFLDITSIVSSHTSEGALSCLAFHPGYQDNGRFFVTYTDNESNSVLAGFQVTADPDVADPTSQAFILTVPQPDPSHNVGWIGFGPDGYLYVASGDGGGSTVGQFAQSTESLLGKLLRIDVDGAFSYVIPPGNPFADQPGRDEIWAVGLRNPWRCSFDRKTGDLWVSDVGDGQHEEVNLQPAGSPGGVNYGWSCMEGWECYHSPTGCTCNQAGLAAAVYDYEHDTGCAIIGGYVYRGSTISQLQGHYVFGDFCAGKVWAYDHAAGTATEFLGNLPWIYSFGEDLAGELYVLLVQGIYKIVFNDCNGNGMPDDQDIAKQTSNDCDGNLVPDECQIDCNANGVPDECDLHADFNGDGVVDAADFLALLQAWGPCPAPPRSCPADLDGDGAVELDDVLILLLSWS